MRRECVGGLARVLPTRQLVALAVVIVAALAGSATATAAGTAPRCEPVDLGIHRGATEGESGVATTTLQFVNVTHRTCELGGYPGLGPYGSDGRRLPVRVVRFAYRGRPSLVDLAPGGRASFLVRTADRAVTGDHCAEVSHLRATPPDDTATLAIRIRLLVCGGAVSVSQVVAPHRVGGGASEAPSCTPAQLRLGFLGGVASTVWAQNYFTFANVSRVACRLIGFPELSLEAASGQRLSISVRDDDDSGGARDGERLGPGDRAAVEVQTQEEPSKHGVCAYATRVRLTAPGTTTSLSVRHGLPVCGRRVLVGAVRSTRGLPTTPSQR